MAWQPLKELDAKRRRQRKAARAAGLKKAPGDLELVRAFVSTVARAKRVDELATPARLGRWLENRGLLDAGAALGEAEQRSALDLRRGLRNLILANSGVAADPAMLERIEASSTGGRFALRYEGGLPVGFGPASRRFDDALGALAAIVVTARSEGLWPRLKICSGSDCRRAFFDTSPNFTGRWCSPQCGDKHRAAGHRRRR
ncbi:MAG: CGNR zinc finger domain-containing protein [bacterium]|nr:CGNR zinc finger domain-containing protein [bacterium]